MARIADLISKDGASDGAAGIGANLWYAEVAQPVPTLLGGDLYVIIPDLHLFGGDTKFGPINWGGSSIPNLGDPLLVAFDNRQQMWAVFPIGVSTPTMLVPTGSMTQFGGAAAPTGWLLCDGTAVSRTTYAALFAVIGVVYGVGNGTTTFNLPDLRGRIPVGKNAATFATLGAVGGEETHVLVTSEIAAHTHTFTGTPMANHSHANTASFSGDPILDHTHANTVGLILNTVATGGESGHTHPSFANQPGIRWSTNNTATGGGNVINNINEATTATGGNTTNPSTGAPLVLHTHSVTPTGSVSITNVAAGAHTPSGSVTMTNHDDSAGTPAGTVNANTGGGGAHNNMPPYIVVNHIIKT